MHTVFVNFYQLFVFIVKYRYGFIQFICILFVNVAI